jgi:glycogen synthase
MKIESAPIGVSDEFFNPKKGFLIPYAYESSNLSGKELCKRRLMEKLNFFQDKPIFLCMSRLVKEKGINLILENISFFE